MFSVWSRLECYDRIYVMPLYVLCFAVAASFKLILCGPTCVDCKYNFA